MKRTLPADVDGGSAETDAGAADAGAAEAGSADAGTVTDAGPAPANAGPMCLLNSDCPETDLCAEVEPGTEMSFCIPGERGTTPYGDACTTSEQCVSGACLEDFCTQESAAADACPNENLPRCSPGLGLCVPAAE